MKLLTVAVVATALVVPDVVQSASLPRLQHRELHQQRMIRRYVGTLRFFAHHPRLARTHAGHRATWRAGIWVRVIRRELRDTRTERKQHLAARRVVRVVPSYGTDYWASKQIAAATVIARESGGDPWPMCPDPFDGGGSWYDTVACENSGSWYDSPGYYRCGLQFDPSWESRFGRLCP